MEVEEEEEEEGGVGEKKREGKHRLEASLNRVNGVQLYCSLITGVILKLCNSFQLLFDIWRAVPVITSPWRAVQ